jgi:tight adherence protein B
MQGTLAPFIYVLAFLAVVLAIQSIAGIVFSARQRNSSVNRRLSMLKSGMAPEDVYSALVRRSQGPNISNARLSRAYDSLATYCRQAGLSITPMRFLASVLGATGVLWLVAISLFRDSSGLGFLAGAVFCLIGAAILSSTVAWIWLNGRRTARLKKLEEQLPLALDVVVRAIRAGHPVVSAVQLAADELGDPIGSEFGLIVDEYTYGAEFKQALLSFARRTGSSDAHFFAVSVGIQSETGGNLAEILDGLSSVIRDRRALGAKVKALASEGKASAMILSLLPVFLISTLMLLQPRFYTDKFADPIFWPVVAIILVLYFIGWIMIRRIVNFKY